MHWGPDQGQGSIGDELWIEERRRWQWVPGREGRPDEEQVTRQDVRTGDLIT